MSKPIISLTIAVLFAFCPVLASSGEKEDVLEAVQKQYDKTQTFKAKLYREAVAWATVALMS